jgi:NAD-dependent protein deacetylase/lipoamidase
MLETMKEAARVITASRIVIGFTGAGISVESGIPDFRTMDHFWEGFELSTFEKEIDNREAFERHPEKVWKFFAQAIQTMAHTEPNDGHKALARLAQLGRMTAIITQNVDGLHQKAGSTDVIEFHGNIMRLQCLRCEATYSWMDVKDQDIPPRCKCGFVLKPEVPLFGDEVNLEAFSASQILAMNAQVMLIAGAHGVVGPVNQIPLIAKDHGAFIVEVNKEESLYTERITDVFLQGKAGDVLPALAQEVEILISSQTA